MHVGKENLGEPKLSNIYLCGDHIVGTLAAHPKWSVGWEAGRMLETFVVELFVGMLQKD